MGDLQEQKRKLDAEVSKLGGERKRVKSNATARQASANRQWVIDGFLRSVVLITLLRSDTVFDPAIVFLRQKGRQRHWPERTDEELTALFGDVFVAASVEELVSLDATYDPTDWNAQKTAVRLVEEWRVARWTETKNRQGLAPSTTAVLGEFARRHSRLSALIRPTPLGTADQGRARMRLTRWRRRFGGRIGKLPVREVVPVAEMVTKVAVRTARAPVLTQAELGSNAGAGPYVAEHDRACGGRAGGT